LCKLVHNGPPSNREGRRTLQEISADEIAGTVKVEDDRMTGLISRRSLMLAGGAWLATPVLAQAQGFPSRVVRIVVPYPPGGPTDALARIIANEIQGDLGQTVIVENKPGAGGRIANELVKAAPADGHTLLMHSVAVAVNPSLFANAGYDTLRDLAPVATPAAIDELIRHLLPGKAWPMQRWHALHPRAWRRQFAIPAFVVLVATAALTWQQGPWGLAALALLPLFLVRAKVWARHAGYSEESGLIAVREGWLDKRWRFAEVRKLQSLTLSQSPFDRRHGMASLHMDTAGANPFEPPLRIRYLPQEEARALRDRLAAAMDARPTPARTAE